MKRKKREAKKQLPFWDIVCKAQKSFRDCSDEELKTLLNQTKKQAVGYAVLKEVVRRQTGLELYDSQIAAACSMQAGHIAELPTGEGKTLSAVVTACWFALQGHKVHVLVFNDYLAQRDAEANQKIYEFCGLSCDYIIQSSLPEQRKRAYASDVVYLAAKEAGFDFLRNFLCTLPDQLTFPGFDTAIVDEADSILIDEARIPLVLAGNVAEADNGAVTLSAMVEQLEEADFSRNRARNQVWLTDQGIAHVEQLLQITDLYDGKHESTLAEIDAALQAKFLLNSGKDYIIRNNEILLVDEATGRVAQNRKFPDLLHRAVQAKEHLAREDSMTVYNSIPMQAFLKSYRILCGMTGTAQASVKEIWDMYQMEVDIIPPHLPCVRTDHPTCVLPNRGRQKERVIQQVLSAHAKGQPVLLGTASVSESEEYGALLQQHGVSCCVLNAANDEMEAEAVARAGELGRVTVSTNLSGRGVDIRLGGREERQAEQVRQAGGLFVIGTALNRSRRIDDQLRGRSGRQGDPGESQYMISLEDPLLVEYYNDQERDKLSRLLDLHSGAAQRTVDRAIAEAQRDLEAQDAEMRYMLSRYSAILERNRDIVTQYRSALLTGKNRPDLFEKNCPKEYNDLYQKVGQGVDLAQRQLLLYYINLHWAYYLSALDQVRESIHFMIIGRKNPLEEYQLEAASMFDEMMEDIKADTIQGMRTMDVTENGIDMKKEGLSGGTTTWTYMIDESKKQFNRMAQTAESVSRSIHSAAFSLPEIGENIKHKLGLSFDFPQHRR